MRSCPTYLNTAFRLVGIAIDLAATDLRQSQLILAIGNRDKRRRTRDKEQGEGSGHRKGYFCTECLYAAEQRPFFLEVAGMNCWNSGRLW
jgi:hypothetical protein